MDGIKQIIKKILPRSAHTMIYNVNRRIQDMRNLGRSPKEVFSEIYKKGIWGERSAGFCSGDGSASRWVTQPYVEWISEFL